MSSLRHKSEFAKAPLDPTPPFYLGFACALVRTNKRKPAGGPVGEDLLPATSHQTSSPGSARPSLSNSHSCSHHFSSFPQGFTENPLYSRSYPQVPKILSSCSYHLREFVFKSYSFVE